jgi:hypothetical protein
VFSLALFALGQRLALASRGIFAQAFSQGRRDLPTRRWSYRISSCRSAGETKVGADDSHGLRVELYYPRLPSCVAIRWQFGQFVPENPVEWSESSVTVIVRSARDKLADYAQETVQHSKGWAEDTMRAE